MRNVGHMMKFMERQTEKNMTQAGTPVPSVSSQSAKESMPERNAIPTGKTTSSSPEQFCVRPARQRQAPKWMKDYVCYV